MNGPEAARSDAQACIHVAEWANRVQGFIEAMPRSEGDGLGDWQAAFAVLEREARNCLNSHRMGTAGPEARDRLVRLAQETGISFAKAMNIPVKMAVMAGGAPEPAEPSAPGRAVPIGGHQLPPLPYPYNALEPHIDEQTMRLHHDKHHKGYVDGLNRAETEMARARETGDFGLIKHWEREAAFNGAGHYLHTIFWNNMSPAGGGDPTGPLADQIRRDFGGIQPFRQHFAAAAEQVEGGGWAALVWAPRAHRLEILQAEKHQNLSQWDVVPLLVLDVWEHAYYLKYHSDRKAYVTAWWNVVNWPDAGGRFEQARGLTWAPA